MKFLPSMLLPFQLLLLLLPSLQVVSFTHSVISLSSTSVQLPSTLLFSAVDGDKDGGTSRSSKKSVQIQPQEPLIFAGVKFHPPISAALKSLSITKPSPIQSASIAAITAGQSCIIHAQTGSGKTLSYVLPVLKRLFGEIDGNENHIFQPLQALILAPTKELAVQIAADIAVLCGEQYSDSMVELCLKSNRRGFDYSTPPIVVGTPFKVLDSIRSTPAALLSCLKYLVLDEVDRQIPVPGRYAVVKEKYDNDKSPANELIDFILDYKIKKLGASDLQVVAASATVGRPLRRELFKIFNKEGDNTYGGDFFVIRPEEKTRDDDKDLSTFTREERLSLKSKRKIGIPDSISHTAVLDSDSSSKEADGLGSKAAIAKSFWVDNPQYKRGIVFVRHTDEVKQVSGMLRFWGLKETKDLQQMLGLEISKKPTAKKLLGKGRIVKQSFVDLPAVSSSEKSNSLIANAMTSGIGSGSNSAIKTSERDLFVVPASGTRGLHIQDIDVVLILQPPATMDEYLHMAGRTGRWGGQDDAMSRRGQVITIANLEEWKRLQSWETPLGIDFDMQYR